MIRVLHQDMKGREHIGRKLSESFAVENEVKQGDAPTLFPIYFVVLLSHAFQNTEENI